VSVSHWYARRLQLYAPDVLLGVFCAAPETAKEVVGTSPAQALPNP
jgi:hypothetical protein